MSLQVKYSSVCVDRVDENKINYLWVKQSDVMKVSQKELSKILEGRTPSPYDTTVTYEFQIQ